MKAFIPFAVAAAALAACTPIPNRPIVDGGPVAPAGTSVQLGQPVWAGNAVLTPMTLVEDSRCPTNARCVWAGRLVLTVRVDGAGWRETVKMVMGERMVVREVPLSLVSATPQAESGGDRPEPAAYRFTFESF